MVDARAGWRAVPASLLTSNSTDVGLSAFGIGRSMQFGRRRRESVLLPMVRQWGCADDLAMASDTAGQLSATWQGLTQIPQLLADIKAGVLTLKTLISTPAAAVATGSPPASGAIVLLGAELAMFLAQTVQAVEQDVEAIRGVQQNYERTEQELAAAATRGATALNGVQQAARPTTGTTTGTASGTTTATTPRTTPRTTTGTTGTTQRTTPGTTAPSYQPQREQQPRVVGRPVPVTPAPPTPTGAAAVDPARRQQLLDAGEVALSGLVQVVGQQLGRVPTPSAPRSR